MNISVRKRRPAPPAARAAADEAASGNRKNGDAGLGVLPQLLGYTLRRTQEAVFGDFLANVTARLSPAGMTPGQFGVLAIIAANPGLKQIELGGALGVDRSTIVAAVDKLEKRGLVERRTVPHDRRAHALNLTSEGQRVYRKALGLIERHEEKIAGGLSVEERAMLLALLAKVMRSAQQ